MEVKVPTITNTIRSLVLCTLCIVVGNSFSQTNGYLDREIAKAKEDGKTEIQEEPLLVDYIRHDTLRALIADRHPVLVTVVGMRASPNPSRHTVFTHYLLRVDQNIRGANLIPVSDTSGFKDNIEPLDGDSFYILASQLGGTITEQGVKITVKSAGTLLTKGKRYILFLAPTPDSEEGVVTDGNNLAVDYGNKLQMLDKLRRPGSAISGLIGLQVADGVSRVRETN